MTAFLLDTHMLLWAAFERKKLSQRAVNIIEDRANDVSFSAVSIWEVTIKRALEKPDFQFDPVLLRSLLLGAGYREIAMTSDHALQVAALPPAHKDPFDRILLAQAQMTGSIFLTADVKMASYGGPVQVV
jgi:PIN domain nuclease of toxin-antitoxin system